MKYYVEERSVSSGSALLTWTSMLKTRDEAEQTIVRLLNESRVANGPQNRFDLGLCELVVGLERS